MPLAKTAGSIARFLQSFCDGYRFQWQSKMSLFGSGKGTVKNLSESLRIAARQNGSAGRTAHRATGMKVGESEAGRGEGVNIRCVVGLASVTSGVSISEVVGNDEHKIRPAGCKAHW